MGSGRSHRLGRQLLALLPGARARLLLATLAIALAIVLLGYATFTQQKLQIQRNAQASLAAIARLKVDEIVRWRQEQIDDAQLLTEQSPLATAFARWLQTDSPTERKWLLARLAAVGRHQSYVTLSLHDAQGRLRLSLHDLDADPIRTAYRGSLASHAVQTRQIYLSDMHWSASGQPELDVVAPLLIDDGDGTRAIGSVYMEIDPGQFLFPLIESWPADSKTAETLMVRRDGDQVTFLNELRHRRGTALTLRLPVRTENLPTAQAVQGRAGFFDGVDYRGQSVVAYLSRVPDTNWFLVSKIDEDEIYAPVRQLALWTSGIALLLLGASLTMVWGYVRRVRLAAHNRQLRIEKTVLSRRFEDLSRFANDIFLLFDERGRIVEVNDQAVTVYGYSREELLQMHGAELRAAEDAPQFDAALSDILAHEQVSVEGMHRRKDGSVFPVDISARVLHLEHGRFIQNIVRDISERKVAEQRLHHLAYYDDLTDLPNRTLFLDHLTQAMRAADRHHHLVAVMLMDLDEFKIVNDTLGHEAGNALLRKVAARLLNCFRAGDTVSRLGGDEFAVVLADLAQAEDATHVAQKILKAFETPFMLDSHEIFVSCSIGITLYPFDDNDNRKLLRNADSAMYHAKSMGRGHFEFYSAELTQRAQRRLEIESGLRRALERDEFVLHYQPQIDLRSGQIVGLEALVRWEQPGKGLVSPAEFIPVAEESGLIVPLGEWILFSACAQAKAWQLQGVANVRVAINLSTRQFAHGRLREQISRILKETGLPPDWLELEITESLLMDSTDGSVLNTLHALRQMGITLAIDDFGTGYSSLGYLKRFPIDRIKIDRSFVQGILNNTEDASLVQAIIAMARSLRMTVIAEGVETGAQLDYLHHHGCDLVQGYFLSRPLAAREIGPLLDSGNLRDGPPTTAQMGLWVQ